MRRKDREVTDPEKIREILDKAKILHLAMFDGEYPYNVPLHYGYEILDGRPVFYIHCAKEGHKLDCIAANPKVCCALDCDMQLVPGDIACMWGATYASVICRGDAAVVNAPEEKVHALKVFMRCQTGREFEITEAMAQGVTVVKITTDDCTAKSRAK